MSKTKFEPKTSQGCRNPSLIEENLNERFEDDAVLPSTHTFPLLGEDETRLKMTFVAGDE